MTASKQLHKLPVIVPNHTDAPLLSALQPDVPRTATEPEVVDPDNPPWGTFAALAVWFLSVGLVLFVPLILLLPYAASRGITPDLADYPKALVEFAITDKMAVILQVAALLPSHLLTLFLVWAVVTRFGKRPFFATLGWSWSGRFGLWSCIGLGIALFMVASFIAWLGGGKSTQLEQIINSSLTARYLISFFAVVTAPFVEEFVYRGVLYSALRRSVGVFGALILALFGLKLDRQSQDALGIGGAVIIVLALFTIIHVPQYWPNIGVIAAVGLLSIALTLIRAYSKRLLPCVVVHLVFNGVQALLLIAEPYFQRLPTTNPSPSPTAALFHLISFVF